MATLAQMIALIQPTAAGAKLLLAMPERPPVDCSLKQENAYLVDYAEWSLWVMDMGKDIEIEQIKATLNKRIKELEDELADNKKLLKSKIDFNRGEAALESAKSPKPDALAPR